MFKLTSNDCITLKLALCLYFLLPTLSDFTFQAPDNLYSVNAQGKLEKYKLTPANFKFSELVGQDEKYYYEFQLTAPKRTILVIKSDYNKIKDELENNDGALIVGPETIHIIGYSEGFDEKIDNQNGNAMDLWKKIADQGKFGQLKPLIYLSKYKFQDFPPLLVEQLTANNKKVFELINSKFFPDLEETYASTAEVSTLSNEELNTNFKNDVLQRVQYALSTFMESTILQRRDDLKKSYCCINIFSKGAHTGNSDLLKVISSYLEKTIENKIDSNVTIVFNKFYKGNLVPLFSTEGIETFLKEKVRTREINLLIETLNREFKDQLNLNRYYTLSMSDGGPDYNYVPVGSYMLVTLLNEFHAYIYEKANAAYKSLIDSPKGKKFLEDFDKNIKSSIDQLDALLKKKYSVEFEGTEKEDLAKKIHDSVNFMDFILLDVRNKILPSFSAFVADYVTISTNYTMLNELMLFVQGQVSRDQQSHFNVGLDHEYSKAAAALNGTGNGITYEGFANALEFGKSEGE